MSHRIATLLVVVTLFSFVSASLLFAKQTTVTVQGTGETRQRAIDNAQRNAVEQAMGVLLESKTYVKDFITESDRIFTVSKGVVKSFKVVKEGTDSGGLFEVTIKAVVDSDTLNGNITMLLHQLDNPKSMVILDPESASRSNFARSARRQIIGALAQQKFEVVNARMTKQLHDEVREMMKVNEANQGAAKLALKYNADVAWLVVVRSAKGQKVYDVQDYTATVGCQVVAATTGKIFADEEITVHGFNEQDAAKKAGIQIATELIDRVKIQFADMAQQGNAYTVRLWGITSYRQARKFKKAITQINGFSDVKQNTVAVDKGGEANFVELTVRFKGAVDELVDKVFDQLESTPGFEKMDLKLQRAGQVEFVMKR